MSTYMYNVKKDLFGCFRIEEIRDKTIETSLKEEGVIEMLTTVLHSRAAPFACRSIRDARSPSLKILTRFCTKSNSL